LYGEQACLGAPPVLLAFAEEDAREAADIRAHLKRRGAPIGAYDVLITANTDEFQRVGGLVVADLRPPAGWARWRPPK
jgi:tRNA(fMet)-specific endonuclease VapC